MEIDCHISIITLLISAEIVLSPQHCPSPPPQHGKVLIERNIASQEKGIIAL